MNLLDICKKVVIFAEHVVTPCFVLAATSAIAFGLLGFVVGVILISAETYVNLKENTIEQ
jgi:hypothetical protein